MGILHGTLVMCKTVRNFICCRPLFSHSSPVEQAPGQAQSTIFEYQGLLQEDTTLEIKDQTVVSELKQKENLEENELYIDPSCKIDKKLIIEASALQQNLLAQIKAPLEGWQQIYKEKKKQHKLQIYTKSYTTQENNKVNILRSSFFVPDITPQAWVKFYNDAEAQRTLDTKLDRYIIVENYQNYFINYASYRKMLMIDSRDILYFKSLQSIPPYLIDVCKSIELEEFPPVESKTRAQIFISGYVVSEYVEPASQQKGTLVEMYSDIDMKMNVPALISRPAATTELRGYVEKAMAKLQTIKEKYNSIPDII